MYEYIKRLLDLAIAIIALVVLSPLFIITILVLLFTGEHTVFYSQERIGYRNKPFYILKFATMLRNSPQIGSGAITIRKDPRVTRVGRFLRSSKINELPQLINVLKGEMSIVGPRPLMKIGYELYPPEIRNLVFDNRPGITGIGSIVFKDEEKIVSGSENPWQAYKRIFPYKVKLEVWYLHRKSLTTDLKIIFITGWSLFFPHHRLTNKFFYGLPDQDFDIFPPSF